MVLRDHGSGTKGRVVTVALQMGGKYGPEEVGGFCIKLVWQGRK